MNTQTNIHDLAQSVIDARARYKQLRAQLVNSLTVDQREVYRFVLLNGRADAAAVASNLYYAETWRAATMLRDLYSLGLLAVNAGIYTVLD